MLLIIKLYAFWFAYLDVLKCGQGKKTRRHAWTNSVSALNKLFENKWNHIFMLSFHYTFFYLTFRNVNIYKPVDWFEYLNVEIGQFVLTCCRLSITTS